MSQANQHNDTIYTKIFVGGLAWETTTAGLRGYFERFGEVVDANVVCETYPGRSKGYGFVIFRDVVSADRALQDPNPIIDGRRTNCNLASLRAKNNMNQPKQNGPLNQVNLWYQYQPPSLPNVDPYTHQFNWNQVSRQYGYMNNYPCYYTYYTQMFNCQSLPYMTSQTWHQTNTRHVLPFAPQRSSAPFEIINETNQEVIADVANHDNEEAVTKPDNDVDQQTENDKEGDNIGQDIDIKQDAMDHKEKINGQDLIKKDVDEEINGNKKDVENQKSENTMASDKHKIEKEQNSQLRNQIAQTFTVRTGKRVAGAATRFHHSKSPEPKGGEIVIVVPRPSVLENMSLEEMKQVFGQLPQALSSLALVKTADGTRARYSRLYRTLAMKVPSLRELVGELEKEGVLKDTKSK